MNASPNAKEQWIYYSQASLWQAGLNWFERYEVIEQHVLAHPDLSEDEMALRLGVEPETIQRALKIMKVLSSQSRRMIRENLSRGNAPAVPSNN